jgi:hypothetical protein
MDPRIVRKSLFFATVGLLGAALTTVPALAEQQQDASQQSTGDAVADAARKARDQKKKDTTKPKKVYTDEDVNHSVSPTPPVPSGTDAADAAAGSNPDAQGAKDKSASGKDSQPEESAEAKWRKQFKEAYASLDRAEKELDILQREDNKAQVQYYSDPQKALTEQYTRKDINEHDAKIAAKKKEIEQIKQRIADMADALRKSGGDPGWGAEP